MKKPTLFAAAAMVGVGVVLTLSTERAAGDPASRGDVVVFVTSQGLYYDSIVNGSLPPKARSSCWKWAPTDCKPSSVRVTGVIAADGG